MTQACSISLRWVLSLVIAAFLLAKLSLLPAQTLDTENFGRMAMSTASLWMMVHHEHKIVEALEQGDLEKALEEAEELMPWMKGTPWLSELAAPAEVATEALQEVVDKLRAGDEAGANAALEVMKKEFKHLHYELMKVVGEGQNL